VVRDSETKVNSVKRERVQVSLLTSKLLPRLEHFTAVRIGNLVQ